MSKRRTPSPASDPVKVTAQETKGKLVSVIVPTYNVEAYITECIKSIQAQTYSDLEIILIDDGSTDGTLAAMQALAQSDARIQILQQENLGPGAARNVGLRTAKGAYLSFVDADDVVTPNFLERMIGSLEKSGSDLVVCNVWRLRNGKLYEAELFKKAIPASAVETHIANHPSLVWDTVVWSKVYRLPFYLEKVGFFPEGILYEDMLPATLAHVRASKIDIIDERFYCWRYRKEETSITQKKEDLKNLGDRLDVMTSILKLYADERKELLPYVEEKQLLNDLMMYVKLIPTAGDEYKRLASARIPPIVKSFSANTLAKLDVGLRLIYGLVAAGRLGSISVAFDASGSPIKDFSVEHVAGRAFAVLPFSSGWNALPRQLYDVTEELKVHAGISAVVSNDLGCELTGLAYIENLPVGSADASRIEAWLEHRKSRATLPLRIERFKSASTSTSPNQSRHNYEWASFRAQISFIEMAQTDVASGEWVLNCKVKAGGLVRTCTPKADSPALAARQFGTTWIRSEAVNGVLSFFSEHAAVIGERAEFDNEGNLIIAARPGRYSLRTLRIRLNPANIAVDQSFEEVSPTLVTATIPSDICKKFFLDKSETAAEVLAIDSTGFAHRIKRRRDMPLSRHIGSSGVLQQVLESPYGNIYFRYEKNFCHVTSLKLSGGRLYLKGTVGVGATQEWKLHAKNSSTGSLFQLSSISCDESFEASLDLLSVKRAPITQGALPIGDYEFFLTLNNQKTPISIAPSLKEPAISIDAGLQFKISLPHIPGARTVKLTVTNRLLDDERGEKAQAQLRTDVYKPAILKKNRRIALLDSFSGKRIDCNPYGIWRELAKANIDIDLRFAMADGSVVVPEDVKTVKRWSREYWDLLGSSTYVITNDWLPKAYTKRQGQFVVQTWHGTPLKRIGFDILQPQFDSAYHDNLANDVSKWDILLSQNAFSTPNLRSAFRFSKEICEIGYPRNDILLSTEAPAIRKRLRSALKATDDVTVILYAPTWRDNQRVGPGAYLLQLGLDLEGLLRAHPKAIVLARWHHLTVPEARFSGHKQVIDVSAYPDIAELFLASDVLITDYSSTMVDYSVTGKPILYYVPDLENYSQDLRGFYIDYINEMPGPLCRTSNELIEALSPPQLKKMQATYAEKYKAWSKKYCHLEDGKAAHRVLERLMALSA